MSPRFPLMFVFWQGDGGDGGGGGGPGGSPGQGGGGASVGPGPGVGPGGTSTTGGFGNAGAATGVGQGMGGPGSAGEAASVGGSTTGSFGFGGGDDGQTSVTANPSVNFGGLEGMSVQGVNAAVTGPTSSAPGGGQAPPGVGPRGGVSTAPTVGGGPGTGGNAGGTAGGGPGGLGQNAMNQAVINNVLRSIGVQGQNPAIVNLMREAGLIGVPRGALTGVPTATTPIAVSPNEPTVQTADINALNQALAALHSGIGGSGGLGTPVAHAPSAPAPSATAVRGGPAPGPTRGAPPGNLGIGAPAAIGNVGGDPPSDPFASGRIDPSLGDLASAFLGGGKSQPASAGMAGGNFGRSPWMMGAA